MTTSENKYPDLADIDLNAWCDKLDCTKDQLMYCIDRVGTCWGSVEAFWSMNAMRIRKSIPEKKDNTESN